MVQQLTLARVASLLSLLTLTVPRKYPQLTQQRAREFYAEHDGKPFFPKLVEFMTSGPIYGLILGKANAIKDWRALMGPTNSLIAKKDAPKRLVDQSASMLYRCCALFQRGIQRQILSTQLTSCAIGQSPGLIWNRWYKECNTWI